MQEYREYILFCAKKYTRNNAFNRREGNELPPAFVEYPEKNGRFLGEQKKKSEPHLIKIRFGFRSSGAEKRIRTSGPVIPVTRFPIVLLKPLRHLCKLNYYTLFSKKRQLFLCYFLCYFLFFQNIVIKNEHNKKFFQGPQKN